MTDQGPNSPVSDPDMSKNLRRRAFGDAYIVGVIVCLIFSPVIVLMTVGVGWATVFGDDDMPGWYLLIIGLVWFGFVFLTPIIPADEWADRKMRKAGFDKESHM